MRPLNRPAPLLDATEMKTYGIVSPRSTHFRRATCQEVDCQANARGWKTILDPLDPNQSAMIQYVQTQSGRRFNEYKLEDGKVVFMFPAGQICFATHQVSLERPANYIVRDGDWRGNPRGTQTRVHARPEDWVEDFALHQNNLIENLNRG